MKKVFVGIQVLAFIAIIAYIIYSFLQPTPKIDYYPETWNSWEGFYTLSYAGVTKKEDTIYVSRQLLREQLDALKKAGYKTIKPDDVVAFLEGRSPLPDKALLLLFEGGRKDSFLYATPILQRLGMTAVMCSPTGQMGMFDSFHLREGDLEKIYKNPHWNPCSMGNDAINEIQSDSSGRKGHFLTTRKWLGKQYEDGAAFQRRVSEDYANAAHILEKVNRGPVATYLYPFADTGKGPEADPLAEEVNRKALAEYHKIAFTSSDNPFNSFFSNPYDLNRLRVQSTWDAAKLIDILKESMSREEPVSNIDDLSLWFIRGGVRKEGNTITFTTGSGIWLRGSDYWSDVDIKATVNLASEASAALYVRADGTDSYVRLTLGQNKIVLLEHHKNTSQTLIRETVPVTGNGNHSLRLRIKGNRAWIWHNDNLKAASVPISPSIVRGRIGIVCPGSNIKLLDFSAAPIPKVFAFEEQYHTLPQALKQKISVILPIWFSVDMQPGLSEQQRTDFLIAASSGIQTIPVIKSEKKITVEDSERFAEALVTVLTFPTVKPFITHLAVYGLERELPDALHTHGYKLLRIMTVEEALRFIEEKEKLNDDLMLICGNEVEVKKALDRLLHVIPSYHIITNLDNTDGKVPSGISSLLECKNAKEKDIQ
jgi:hypothetical protein